MNSWIFPCNPQKYDLHEAFRNLSIVEWHQNLKDIEIGDYVFIYVSKPSSRLEMLCEVIEVNIPSVSHKYDDSKFVFDKDLADTIKSI
jgi:predicted RNA-binding protein with PUA-like domain